MLSGHGSSILKSATLLTLLIILGYLGNYFRIPLFLGADFLLGSIAGLVIISLYGWRWGLLGSLIISSYTYFLWGHFCAVFIFSLESLFVGLLLRSRKENLLLIDGLFWLLIGLPSGWLLYGVIMDTGATGTSFIVFKQAVNGIFNALFASLAVSLLPFERAMGRLNAGKSISLRESLFNLLVALALIPSFLIVMQNSRSEVVRIERDALLELPEISASITSHLQSWYQDRLHTVGEIAALAGRTDMTPSEDLQHDLELIKKGFPDFQAMYVADTKGETIAHQPAVNEMGESTIGMNFADRPYFHETRRTNQPVLSEVFLGRGSVSSPIVVLSVPVVKEGRFVGLVCTALDLARIRGLLEPYWKDRGVTLTLADPDGLVIATTAPGREIMQAYDGKKGWDSKQIDNVTYHRFPSGEKYQMARWRKSFYVQEERISTDIPWTLIIESPLAPLQEHLHSIYAQNFFIMTILAVVALLLAHIFQRWPSRPLEELAKVTTNLPGKLLKRQEIEWPKSSAAEIQFLIANFRSMADALKQKLQELSDQTSELARTNQELQAEICERKHAEDTLVETTNVLQELIDASPLAIIALDRDRKVEVWNRAAEQLFGWRESEVLAQPLPFFSKDQDGDFRLLMDEELTGPSLVAKELRRHGRDGSPIDVSIWTAPLRDAHDKPVGMIALFADISEMKRSREALRESEAKFRKLYKEFQALLDAIPDEIALLSPEFKVIWANRSVANRLGKDSNLIIGSKCSTLWGYRDEPCDICPARTSFRTNGPASAYISTPDGRTRESRSMPVQDESGRVLNVIEVVRDITDQRRIERQLQQAQKMEAIGTLAGGIAHDFNNILGIISGYVELARMDAGESSEINDSLMQVLKGCMRAKDLVQQILTFSRQTEQERRPLLVGPIVKEALKLLRASLPATTEIRQAIESDGITIADPTQIHQVVMNLCMNAHHAMRETGGMLEVSLEDIEVNTSSILDHPGLHTGSYLQLRVSDTGHGMSTSTMKRIFDPFFTTKEPGDGTGLGLAVVHGIVTSLDGTIEVGSRLGIGATFDVFLPRAGETTESTADHFDRQRPTGIERILFVDDEEALTLIGGQMLKRLGYNPTAKTSSVEALELFKNHPDRFDLVVTDLTMPNMTGIELAEGILAIRPHIPVIICTGFSEAWAQERAKAIGIHKLLMKPIEIDKLAAAVREAFDGNMLGG